jgi:hypothetical protein
MKKILLLSTVVLLLTASFASTNITVKPRLKASEILIPLGNTGQKISLLTLSQMSIKDVEELRGTKMKFADRIAFKAAQRQLKKNINADGTIDSKRLQKQLKKGGETGFHFGGFALGFLLGIIGVIIAYIIKDDYKRNRVKWAWIGMVAWIVIYGAILLAA